LEKALFNACRLHFFFIFPSQFSACPPPLSSFSLLLPHAYNESMSLLEKILSRVFSTATQTISLNIRNKTTFCFLKQIYSIIASHYFFYNIKILFLIFSLIFLFISFHLSLALLSTTSHSRCNYFCNRIRSGQL
jgi:hypothetical protein